MTPHEAAMTLEWVTGEFMLRWLKRVPGLTIERFGSAWGACAPERPELDFHNTVHRLLPDDVEQVPRIAERYAAAGVRPWLELMPPPGFERLAAALQKAGAHQVDFLGVFERDLPEMPPKRASAIEILQPPPDIEEFSTVLLTGHGLSRDQLIKAVPLNTPMAAVEGAILYLATVDGRPAAAAALFIQRGIGHLATGCMMPRRPAAHARPWSRRGTARATGTSPELAFGRRTRKRSGASASRAPSREDGIGVDQEVVTKKSSVRSSPVVLRARRADEHDGAVERMGVTYVRHASRPPLDE